MPQDHVGPLGPGIPDGARSVGRTALTDVSFGVTTITREVMQPGWRWAEDVKPVVGTALCAAGHRLYVVSGRMQVVTPDAEFQVAEGDAVVIYPGHDAWTVGDDPCVLVDFSSEYSHLIAAGDAYQRRTEAARGSRGHRAGRTDVVADLRADARAGRLDSGAVEIVLSAVGRRSSRASAPAGLTARETQVLVLIASGASANQVARMLGIRPKTAATHIERIYAKSAVTNRASATRFAIQHGLIDPIC
ncbi:LuxR C-terminal-related transcriptional regulator [Modestobacter sp. VKM Ac-2983]|uniref:LuxR C-terminal-related transcriptional regulator n=1 Tax=Modestobacter sp. VKM Ac-2983 TaxID=3004137 RepID=UPI0022AB5AEE|nr:LuxR C-terminal-related transcriptional regulator [Modestobacter sp. VKM Ac-2983]MCZ2805596.1 LuxR C-terminal-related transcriptional regulator [Modestobacter sp. VKM Ac-2983]